MGRYFMRLLRHYIPRNDVRSTLIQTLVFLFFFLLPTQLAKHFWPAWSYIQGIRIDYLSPTVSVIDVLSLIIITVHLPILVHIIRTVKRDNFLILGILILTNLLFSLNFTHSLVAWIHSILNCSVIFIVVKEGKRYFIPIFMGLCLSSAVQLFLVCSQFVSQSSQQGVWYLLGERRIVLSLPDVAKISVYGREYLRPYGTFSHPNALGGFYVLLFFFIFWIKEYLPPAEKRVILLTRVILFICPFLILASFSKIAILSFVLGSLALVWNDYMYRRCALCLIARTSMLVLVLLMFTIPIGDPYSLQKRLVLISNSLKIFFDHPLWGVGYGNYIIAQSSISILPRYMPLYQPVHNMFLLILTELGVGGMMLMYFFIRKLKMLALGGTYLLPIVFVVLPTGMFDHYWITQPQTQMLLIFVVLSILIMGQAMVNEHKKRPM